ncbi:MAG: hypothetical protein E7641_05540 [Ruminococcaceae bacterium]|nr:hypothetical protein [Oscillospiraceae bacterium]
MSLLISGIKVSLDGGEAEAYKIAATEMKRVGLSPTQLRFRVYKKSIDARKKSDIRLVYSIAAELPERIRIDEQRLSRRGITVIAENELSVTFGTEKADRPPLVVGMGPAGLFAALLLAENGYEPIIIDRGDDVRRRVEVNEGFVRSGRLDSESNIQFGAGGAGTFSDGKLMTRVNDEKIAYVLKRLYEFGAPEEILTSARPHIGTDKLVDVVEGILRRIAELGGRVIYRCRLDSMSESGVGVTAHTSKGDIECSSVILATGHSARDTYGMLIRKGYMVAPKDFSVGVRIEHKREDIDRALYGDFAGHSALGAAEYHLSDTTGDRGVYTFCMCPGGTVVASASEEGGVVVNGMSNYARDGENSNSALLVSVRKSDVGESPEGAIEFQRQIERLAFLAGGSDYCAPVETVGDLMRGKHGTEPSRIIPSYRDGKVRTAELEKILPPFVTDGLKRGIASFDKKISGFAADDAVLTAPETRTSAPLRILRGDELTATGHERIYPCGEGAGYAGGITSAALDGIKCALALMKKYSPM